MKIIMIFSDVENEFRSNKQNIFNHNLHFHIE